MAGVVDWTLGRSELVADRTILSNIPITESSITESSILRIGLVTGPGADAEVEGLGGKEGTAEAAFVATDGSKGTMEGDDGGDALEVESVRGGLATAKVSRARPTRDLSASVRTEELPDLSR